MAGTHIEHVVPQIGTVHLPLYEPADWLFDVLKSRNEIRRLSQLRHLGALSFALEGARLARWDYTAALINYALLLRLPGFNSKFRIGSVRFSSLTAALQCSSLLWNIGHLPGTFAAEKGVYRHLITLGKDNIVDNLPWQFRGHPSVDPIIERATAYLLENDYPGLCRVLAVIKLLGYCDDDEHSAIFSFVTDFAAPLLLRYESEYSKQWPKIRSAFSIVRHLSYLTLDIPFSGQRWAPNIPDLVEYHIREKPNDLPLVVDRISELLSPIEKQIYDRLYHCKTARVEASIFAGQVAKKLNSGTDTSATLEKWIKKGLTRDLSLGRRPPRAGIKRCVSIQLRSHFSTHPDSCSEIERKLHEKGFPYSVALEYKAWNSEALLEPDELLIDVLLDRNVRATDIGTFLAWYCNEFDTTTAKPDDFYELMRKGELETGYAQILSKAVTAHYPGTTVHLEPWSLERFGLFKDVTLRAHSGKIWLSSSMLDDPITKYLVRDRSKSMPPGIMDQYQELLGIAALRRQLRSKFKKSRPRCKWLLLTSSVQFQREGQNIMEYDGGILRVSSRSGNLTWYGLESKNGRENPTSSLRRRLKTLGVQAEVLSISQTHACAKVSLY